MTLAVGSVGGDLTLLLDLSSSPPPPPAQQLQNPIRTLGRKRLLAVEWKMLVTIAGRRGIKRCPHVLHNVAAAVDDDGSPNVMVLFGKDDDVVVPDDEDSIGEREGVFVRGIGAPLCCRHRRNFDNRTAT